jgi:cephalosporin hydroxylase
VSQFVQEVNDRITTMSTNEEIRQFAFAFMRASIKPKYSYNFSWLGRPIIQYPQDMVALQEVIWTVRPDLIIETGIAHGGSLIMSASLLALLDLCEASEAGTLLDPCSSGRLVLGVDIDIRPANRAALESHPLTSFIRTIEGSSVDAHVIGQVRVFAEQYSRVLVCLDSNHAHDHVLAELEAYAPMTSIGSYCVVFDTIVEDLPGEMFPDRPWGPGNSPKTAVGEFLRSHPEFEIDRKIDNKLLISAAPGGYLKRTR